MGPCFTMWFNKPPFPLFNDGLIIKKTVFGPFTSDSVTFKYLTFIQRFLLGLIFTKERITTPSLFGFLDHLQEGELTESLSVNTEESAKHHSEVIMEK